MKYLFNILICTFCIFNIVSCTKDEEVTTGIITGVITDITNANEPIAGATVTVSPTGLSKTTGSDGRYEFPETEAGTYNLTVKANGYQEDSKTVTVYAGRTTTADFQLSIGSTDIEISPFTLNFGPDNEQLSFTIKNKSNRSLQYNISNYPAYLTVSPSSALISAKGTQTVLVKINRSLITSNVSFQLIVNIGNDSYPVSITINSQDASSKISVSPTTLNFGKEYTELLFTIKNISTSGTLPWNISTPTNKCLSVSPKSGSLSIGESQPIIVKLDRSLMTGDIPSAFINVNTEGETIPVTVTAKYTSEGNNDDNENGESAVTQGLYVYYKFDDNFDDSSENAIHGFGYNNPTFTQGVTTNSKAVKFSRTDKSSFVVPHPIIDSREMSISFWGKDFNNGGIFHMTSSHNDNMFTLSMDENMLKFIVTRYNNNYKYTSTGTFMHSSLNDGKWHHIVLTSDFNKTTYATITTTLYVDGQAVDVITEYANPFTEGDTSDNSYGSGVKFVLGGEIKLYNSVLNATNMSVDNFRVYDSRRLTADEVKAIYNAEK